MCIDDNIANQKPAAPSSAAESTWTCLTCGTINTNDNMLCMICSTRRRTDRSDEQMMEPQLCRVWFSCPKCGIHFEREGQDLSEIRFGTCPECLYSPDKGSHSKTLQDLLKRFFGKQETL